jgi:undecaprenyl pyrophosphate phosphatase UppP
VAARSRGFAREDAHELAFEVGVPVTIGAIALKLRELESAAPAELAVLAAGAMASYVSTLATASLVRRSHSLVPYAAYRAAVAGIVLRRLRKNGRS